MESQLLSVPESHRFGAKCVRGLGQMAITAGRELRQNLAAHPALKTWFIRYSVSMAYYSRAF